MPEYLYLLFLAISRLSALCWRFSVTIRISLRISWGDREIVVLTNLEPEIATAAQVMQLYRERWQVEMLQPQCPHKSEAIEAEAVSALTVFGASEHSLQQFKGIRKGQFQWEGS